LLTQRGPPEQVVVLPLKMKAGSIFKILWYKKIHNCSECPKHQSSSLQYTIIRIL